MQLAERLREVFRLDPESWAIEFEGKQYSWGALAQLVDAVGQAVKRSMVSPLP